MLGKIYLRPVGLLWGRTAGEAIAAGHAYPVAGGSLACSAFETIERNGNAAVRRIVAARDLATSADPAIAGHLKHIAAKRAPLPGLDFSRPVTMGIVNVTPDSFSDGGDFAAADSAIRQIKRISADGADILDIGGESTRPGADPVSEEEELRRVKPVIATASGLGKIVSADTRKARVMDTAIGAGAHMLNDVSALTHDADALPTAARLSRPTILMHSSGDPRTMQDAPHYADVLLDVFDFLEARIHAAEKAGLPRARLLADPGIGFGKTLEHNLTLLAGVSLFHCLGVPLVIGVSRKRMIGALTGETDAKKRAPGSIGAALSAVSQGVQIVRVHDVRETVQALTCWHKSLFSG